MRRDARLSANMSSISSTSRGANGSMSEVVSASAGVSTSANMRKGTSRDMRTSRVKEAPV